MSNADQPPLHVEGLIKAYRGRRVVDGVGFHVEPGEIGVAWIRGAAIGPSTDGWVRTGDLCYRDSRGWLWLVGFGRLRGGGFRKHDVVLK